MDLVCRFVFEVSDTTPQTQMAFPLSCISDTTAQAKMASPLPCVNQRYVTITAFPYMVMPFMTLRLGGWTLEQKVWGLILCVPLHPGVQLVANTS